MSDEINSESPIEARLHDGDRPKIVEFWAPWCGPCRQMEPLLEELSDEYREAVDTIRVNADEHPGLAAELKIYAIPTVLIYENGAERARRSGAQSRDALTEMYAAARERRSVAGVTNRVRFIRIAIAVGIGVMAQEFTVQWPFYLAAGAVFFSAIHDRCPIWQAAKRIFTAARPRET